jgi:DNA-binding winged helix-turn-helix (wHTH) protein/tetratricopeptide (TPR) repeat protein
MPDIPILLFDSFRVDLRDERLWRGEEVIHLTHKAFAVLRYLLQHPAQLVPKEALLDAVWPETYVSDAALTVCIRELRQGLGDDARAPQFIETVRGRGYRFLAPVTVAERSAAIPEVASPAALAPGAVSFTPLSFARRPITLVGREAELTRLQQWLASALERVRQVGFISGEVGIGKTTLVDAFVAQVEGEAAVWIGHGQCIDQYGAGEAYLPLLEALGRLCRGPEGRYFLNLLRQQAPSWLIQMPTLLSEDERAALERQESGVTQARMLRELAEAVETLTTERPLLLVLEDLHWSDASTLAWLAYVARRREVARLLVLGTYRPVQAIVAEHPLRTLTQELRGHGQCEELLLDYLSEAAVAAYLAERCPGPELPGGLAPMLHQRTDGNPLFLVTLVDTLVRQGVLAEGTTGWHLPGGMEAVAVEVPESLRQLIEQQLEEVSSEDQTLLETASVAGAEFSAAAVAAGVGCAAEEVEARCAALARRGQFVQGRGSAAWPDGTVAAQYGFIHALYQEVLYDRIPAGRRVRWHEQIGGRLEVGYGGQAREIAAALAEHFVRGRDAPRAVQYLWHAGENARRRSAYQEAIAHLSKGLEVLGTLSDTVERAQQEVDLQTTLGLAFMAAKGYAAPEVRTAYTRARALCQQLDDAPKLSPVLSGLWIFHLARAELHTARDMAEQLLQLGQGTQDPAALGSAHHGLGQILYHMGEFFSAKEHCEQALALFTHQLLTFPDAIRSVQDGRVLSLGYMAFSLWHLGYPDQALQKTHEALALARELSHPFTMASALHFAAVVHWCRGEKVLAQERNEEMLALSVEQGFPPFVAGGNFAKHALLLEQGKIAVDEGIAQMRRSLDTYRATGVHIGLPQILTMMAMAEGAVGQVDEGFALLAEAQDVAARTGECRHESALSLLKGSLLLGQEHQDRDAGDLGRKTAEAEAHSRHAIAVARRQQAKSLELQAVMSLSRLWQQQGKRDEARELLVEVVGWFSEGFDTGDLKAAKALLEALG